MNNVMIYTCAGGMKVGYLKDFVRGIPFKVVDKPYVETHIMKPQDLWHMGVVQSNGPASSIFERQTSELVKYHTASKLDMLRNVTALDAHFVREQALVSALKCMEDELKVWIAKRNPTFFMKDLSLEKIDELSVEFMNKMGNDAFGFHVELGKYQKFFVIADPNDFVFYTSELEVMDVTYARPTTEFRGRLVDLRPDKWQMGRYDNLEYLKELSARQMYVAGRDPDEAK